MFDVVTGSWDNPCSSNAVRIASKLSLNGVDASVMNQDENKVAFTAAVEDGIYETNGNKVSVIDVDAQDAGGRRTRRLLASSVDVTFKVS